MFDQVRVKPSGRMYLRMLRCTHQPPFTGDAGPFRGGRSLSPFPSLPPPLYSPLSLIASP